MRSHNVSIKIDGLHLDGLLTVPDNAAGTVLFAHGSGSGRHSARNQLVARALNAAGLATLLFDLLTPKEEQLDASTGHLRFDTTLLGFRLGAATDWLRTEALAPEPFGYFGASTGAAAAIRAATGRAGIVRAIVSRGGRPDLAGDALEALQTPILLIVGGADRAVVERNAEAFHHLRVEKEMVIIPGATHLFPEPGALGEVARLASEWLSRHLTAARVPEAAW